MVFLADYNGDPVDKVLAISGRVYDRTNNNEAPCTITTRSSPDKIMITSKLYTDNSQNHVNPCGARQTVSDIFLCRTQIQCHVKRSLFYQIYFSRLSSLVKRNKLEEICVIVVITIIIVVMVATMLTSPKLFHFTENGHRPK